MYSISGTLMQELDKNTQKRISSYDLMEEAGRKMASIILDRYKFKNVLAIIGMGGNAGDALVILRILKELNINVSYYKIGEIKNKDALKNELLLGIKPIDDISIIDKYDILIDGIFGVGLNRVLDDKYINIINIMNNSNKKIISLDIPSGIDSNSGISYGAFVKSDLLITVQYLKNGLFLNDGISSYKDISVIDIGIDSTSDYVEIIEKNAFNSIFKKRDRNTNKGNYGKASIIAGSQKYPGASLISYNALASFKMGVGYQNLYVVESLYNLYALAHPEIITNKIPELDGHIKFDKDTLDNIIKHSDSISIGMGMGVSIELYNTIDYLLKNYNKTLIIDADGINTISKYGIDILNDKKCDLIITPHLKEFERLTNIPISEIKNNMIYYASDFSKKYNLTIILKSNTSVISNGKSTSINISGTTALAKAGSGDSLIGILTGLCAYLNNIDIYTKAKLASYMLGRISEVALDYSVEESLTITEMIKYIPNVIKELKEK